MTLLHNPADKYRPFPPVDLSDRQWPAATLTRAPVWLSTDLRDGNQSLFEPMNVERKLRMFQALCAIGFKEIEVAFPSASQADFDFVRTLIEEDLIPDDVTIEVITQARPHLIDRTVESLRGARRAIVHVYNATSRPFREVVFGMSKAEVQDMAVNAVRHLQQLTARQPETDWVLQYSPETFTATELDFALQVCNAVTCEWGASAEQPVIINLPTTVEVATPNVYADQIEWMHCHLDNREAIVLSLHPHNDRGTAVAAAELGLMAGADRVEGCLFGNGERTGNVDLVTLALNLYTQGVSPQLDFSDISGVARMVEHCNQLPVHPRHPYAGDLVFTAFSGSHQDAIRKGFAAQQPDAVWNVPYLPIDPADLGRNYDSVIRVNSQSGKGGVAYLLEKDYGIRLPRRLQVEFSRVVQDKTDRDGGELSAADIWQLFADTYLHTTTPIGYVEHHLFEQDKTQGVRLVVEKDGVTRILTGNGNGPIDAASQALQAIGLDIAVHSFEEYSIAPSASGGDARACAIVEVRRVGHAGEYHGVGMHENTVTASIRALLSACNRIPQVGVALPAVSVP